MLTLVVLVWVAYRMAGVLADDEVADEVYEVVLDDDVEREGECDDDADDDDDDDEDLLCDDEERVTLVLVVATAVVVLGNAYRPGEGRWYVLSVW